MNKNLFRNSFNHLLDVYGDKDLRIYKRDTSNVTTNSYGEITGGTTYLIKQCAVRGKVIADPLEVQTVTDESASYISWDTLTAPAVFKVSATDLIKGGVVDSLGNYNAALAPTVPTYQKANYGLLNMFLTWHGEIYDILAIQKGIVYQGNPTAYYLTCQAVYDTETITGRSDLGWIDDTATKPDPDPGPGVDPDPGEDTTYTVYVDGTPKGVYKPGTLVVLEVPELSGYIFNGWTSEQVEIEGNSFTMPESDVIITSKWIKEETPDPEPSESLTLTVRNINPNDDQWTGEENEKTWEIEYMGAYTLQAGINFPGYKFKRWYIVSGTGSFSSPLNVGVGGGEDGWTPDDGWTNDFEPVTETTDMNPPFFAVTSCVIECEWEEIVDPRPSVTYIGVDGKSVEHYDVGDTVYISAGTKDGQVFRFWTVDGVELLRDKTTNSNSFTMPDNNVTVTAEWCEDGTEYTVTFYGADGVFTTQQVEVRRSITDPGTPTKENYEFNGWYTAADGGKKVTLSDVLVVEDVSFYAHWIGEYKTITFNTDGGNTIQSKQVRYGEPIGELETPVKSGAEFVQWTYNGEPVTPETVVYEDMELLATWEAGVSEEISHIGTDLNDLNFCMVLIKATANWTSTSANIMSSTYPTMSNPYTRRTRAKFHTADWGQFETPDAKYTTDGETLIPGTAVKYNQVFDDTRVNLYTKRPPTQLPANALTSALYEGWVFKNIDGAAFTTPSGSIGVLCLAYICNDSGGGATTPDQQWGDSRIYCVKNVVDIGEGWYRVEIAGIKAGQRAQLLDRVSPFPGSLSNYTNFDFTEEYVDNGE